MMAPFTVEGAYNRGARFMPSVLTALAIAIISLINDFKYPSYGRGA